MNENFCIPKGIKTGESNRNIVTIQRFQRHLAVRGYRAGTINQYVSVLSHMELWLTETHHRLLEEMQQSHITEFLCEHLPICRCFSRVSRSHDNARAALWHLLRMLGHALNRDYSEDDPRRAAVQHEVAAYDAYMRDSCGLSDNTRLYRRRHITEFLTSRSNNGGFDFSNLKPVDLIDYVLNRTRGLRPGSTASLSSSIRSYLGYLQMGGRINPQLRCVIPSVAQWRLAEIPRVLSEPELQTLLQVFNLKMPSGRRDYAILLCMIDLGLRASEVADLELSDIDWHQSVLQITRTKSRNTRLLPITVRSGAAIAGYLYKGRPESTSSFIFLRHSVPVGDRINSSHVRGAMRRAYARAGFPCDWTGTHMLRRTAATRMHRNGVSLKDIADILGHAAIDTTLAYTKINIKALRTVAMPWPRSAS